MNDLQIREKYGEGGSILVNPYSALLLFLLFLFCAYYRAAAMSVFFLFLFLLSLSAWVWKKNALKDVHLSLDAVSCRTFPGAELLFSMTIRNDKALPLFWLEAILPQPPDGMFEMREREIGRFHRILPFQEVTWECLWKGVRRGIYQPRDVALLSGDGFGLSFDVRTVVPESMPLFVIYPAVFAVRTDGFLNATTDLTYGRHGYQEDLTLLKSTHAYRPGDAAKRINWRILAAQSRMEVNRYEEILPRSVTFVPDLFSFAKWGTVTGSESSDQVLQEFYGSEMEDMISLAASLILSLSEKKAYIRLVLPHVRRERTGTLPGFAEAKEQTVFSPAPGDGAWQELLTALSGIRYFGEQCAFSGHELEQTAGGFGQVFVLCRSAASMTCARLLERFAQSRICLLTHNSDAPHPFYRTTTLAQLKEAAPAAERRAV